MHLFRQLRQVRSNFLERQWFRHKPHDLWMVSGSYIFGFMAEFFEQFLGQHF